MNKKLIIYYSHSGNTKKCVDYIKELTNADVLEIEPIKAYPSDVWETIEIFKNELKTGHYPDIKDFAHNLSNYDEIYFGTPNWGNTLASPLITFLKKYDLSDKTIYPFTTHGGGGSGKFVKGLKQMSGSEKIKKELAFNSGNINKSEVEQWLE